MLLDHNSVEFLTVGHLGTFASNWTV